MSNPQNQTPTIDEKKPDDIPPVSRDPADLEDQDSGDMPPLRVISASTLVDNDKDRPIADANPQPRPEPVNPDRPDDPTEPKKRGRPKLSDEEKEARKKAKAAGLPPPNFDDIRRVGNPSSVGLGVPVVAPRDYTKDAASLYIPASMALGQFLGDHWAIKMNDARTALEFTPEQLSYMNDLARWLEYEQFGPINPRYKIIFSTIAYAAPRLRTDPTPHRLKNLWGTMRETVGGWFGRKKKNQREKDKEETNAPE